MTFEEALRKQLKNHPSIELQDIIKMCYQATFGAEHLLLDLEKARAFFEEEFEATEASDEPVYEELNEEIVRVNFGAWKKAGLPKEELFAAFVKSTQGVGGTDEALLNCLGRAERVLEEAGFDMEAWAEAKAAYIEAGMNPVHHSQGYRDAESPAYRVVKREYLEL